MVQPIEESSPSEPLPEPLNQRPDEDKSENTSRFTPLSLTREQVLELIKQLRTLN
jgi:hypothetical protein